MSGLDLAGLNRLLNNYAAAWAENRSEAIAGHWNPERFAMYKAEEIQHYFFNWPEVLDYWRQNEGLHEGVSLRFSDKHIKPLSEDLAAATVRLRWDIRFATNAQLPDGTAFPHRGQAMGGDNHVLMLVCQERTGWKLCAWSETPDAPITYIRSLYLANADTNVV